MLTLSERVALVVHCGDHLAVICPECSEATSFDQPGTNIVTSIPDCCPRCNAELTHRFRQHLAECTWIRVQVRGTRSIAHAMHDDARRTVKVSEQLRDRADVLAREAESERERGRRIRRGPAPESHATSSG
jgi:hypothetical protein